MPDAVELAELGQASGAEGTAGPHARGDERPTPAGRASFDGDDKDESEDGDAAEASYSFARFMSRLNGPALFAPLASLSLHIERLRQMRRRYKNRPPPRVDGFDIQLVKGAQRRGVLDVQSWVVFVLNVLLAIFKLCVLAMFGTLIALGSIIGSTEAFAATAFLLFVYATSLIGIGFGGYGLWTRAVRWAKLYAIYLAVTLAFELALEAAVYVFFVRDFPGPQDLLQRNTIFMVFVAMIWELLVVVLMIRVWRTLATSTQPETIVRVRRLHVPPPPAHAHCAFAPVEVPLRGTAAAAPSSRYNIILTTDPRSAIVQAEIDGDGARTRASSLGGAPAASEPPAPAATSSPG